MTMPDPLSDMLTRIRNANTVFKPEVQMPSSKLKEALAQVLKKEGYISGFDIEKSEDYPSSTLNIKLKYANNRRRVITGIKTVSKPGLRVYTQADKIPRALDGLGITVLSTSSGLMTDREATKKRIGGEILCQVW